MAFIRDGVPKITPQTAADFARRSHEPNKRVSKPSTLETVLRLQERLCELALDAKTVAREAAQVVIAWDKLEARKAVLMGKPANTSQSIKSEPQARSRKSDSGPLESLPTVPESDEKAPP